MKTKEELNALKEEVEAMNKKLAELTEEELKQVSGGGPGRATIQLVCPDCGYVFGEYPYGAWISMSERSCPSCNEWVNPEKRKKQ